MANMIDVTMYCVKNRRQFKTFFEEKNPGEWYGVRTEVPKQTFTSMLSQFLPLKKTATAPSGKHKVQGGFFTGSYKCPFCGNTGFVSCNTCGAWTCMPVDGTTFRCGGCGINGKITGKIDSASGNLTDTHDPSQW